MAGTQLRVLEKTTYTFAAGGNNQIPAGKNVTIPVAVNVDLSAYLYAFLVLRVHSFTSGGTGDAKVQLQLWNSAPTTEDPTSVFRVGAATISGVQLAATTASPQLDVKGSGAGVTGGFGDILLVVSGASASAGDITVTVSADLVLKS